MVNWLKTWRRASFRGAKFWVDKDQVGTGRRLVVHEFPHRDTPYVEDMGRAANKISVTAYVASDSALSEAQALFKACEARGAATLQLPEERLKAQCETCERAWDKDKQGYLAFSLSFWREGTGPGPFPAPYLQRLTFSAAAALPAVVGAFLASGVSTVGRPGFVRDAAADAVRGLAVDIDAVRAALPVDPATAPDVMRAIQDLYDEAVPLSTIGSEGDGFAPDSYIGKQQGSETVPEIAARMGAILADLRAGTPPADAAVGFVPLTEADEAGATLPRTPSRRVQAANASALALSLRVTALAQWAVAVTEIDYRDRRAAIQARADLAERFDAVLDGLAGPSAYPLFVALTEVRDTAITYLTRLLTDLAPVNMFETGTSMPSLWWSWRLYADAGRAEELIARNRAFHASFMPREIEALAV